MGLRDLLAKAKQDAAAARSDRTPDLEKLKSGDNYLRVFPNKKDPENGIFYHQYGIHYAKQNGPDGKPQYGVHICDRHTFGKACPTCEMTDEAKLTYKGNEAMMAHVRDIAATARFVVVGMLSNNENFSGVEGARLIDLPQSVFDDICSSMAQDEEDNIGNALSVEEGYGFLIKRTGSGRDTRYEITPKRKTKGPIPSQFWSDQPSITDFVNQKDPAKLAMTARIASSVLGIAPPAGLLSDASGATGLPGMSGAGTSGTGLPGMSTTPVTPTTPSKSDVGNVLLEEELKHAEGAVFTPEPEPTPEVNEPSMDDELAALAALSGL